MLLLHSIMVRIRCLCPNGIWGVIWIEVCGNIDHWPFRESRNTRSSSSSALFLFLPLSFPFHLSLSLSFALLSFALPPSLSLSRSLSPSPSLSETDLPAWSVGLAYASIAFRCTE